MDEREYEFSGSPQSRNRHISGRSLLHTRSLSSSIEALESCVSPSRRNSPGMSRKAYGSVEELLSLDISGERKRHRFRVESFSMSEDGDQVVDRCSHTAPYLENPEYETRWYFKYFLGRAHQNFLGSDENKNPFFLSVVATDADNHGTMQHRCILWHKSGNQRLCLPLTPGKSLNYKTILQKWGKTKFEKTPRELVSPAIQKDLLTLEEQEGAVNFKFGVLYCKERQTAETEMFSNETGSEQFGKFLDLLGDVIQLQDWDRFRGGLDVKTNTTGTQSVYTVYKGHEIMFHVSTMLPFSRDNPQQVERKRHIGNDICVIVFCEGKYPSFQPSSIKSKFIHVFAVVSYDKEEDGYRLQMYSAESVPLFGPALPNLGVFKDHIGFRELLLAKLMNGEKAAYGTPIFKDKRERTLDLLIRNLEKDYDAMMAPRRSLLILPETLSPRIQRRKVQARVTEFQQIGQDLKLKKIMKGDHPTSLQTSSLFKKDPWEPQLLSAEIFSHDIVCGDSWGDQVVIASSDGVFILYEDHYYPLINKMITVQQLTVCESHDVMVFRGGNASGKERYVYVFRTSELNIVDSPLLVKSECRSHRIQRTKGCHLFACSPSESEIFQLAVAVKNKVQIYQWGNSNRLSTASDMELNASDVLSFIREVSLADVPCVMTMIHDFEGSQKYKMCFGYKQQFDLVSDDGDDRTVLYEIKSGSKVIPVSAVDLYEETHAEVVLTYGHNSLHRSLSTVEDIPDVEIKWNHAPSAIACAFPYMMGFSSSSIEIRLAINGSLVHTLKMPDIRLISAKNDLIFCSSASGIKGSPPCSHKPKFGSPSRFGRMRTAVSVASLVPLPSDSTENFIYRISADTLAGITSAPRSPTVNSPTLTPPPLSPLVPLVTGAPQVQISRLASLKRVRGARRQTDSVYKSLEELELALSELESIDLKTPTSPVAPTFLSCSPLQ